MNTAERVSHLKISAEDQAINGPMEQMVSTYDAYMRKVTMGREHGLARANRRFGPGPGPGTRSSKSAAGPAR